MKKGFIVLFLGAHITFIVLQIHKHSEHVKLSYQKQKTEREIGTLNKRRDELMQRLHVLKSPEAIKKYAQEELNMEELTLRHIKKLPETIAG